MKIVSYKKTTYYKCINIVYCSGIYYLVEKDGVEVIVEQQLKLQVAGGSTYRSWKEERSIKNRISWLQVVISKPGIYLQWTLETVVKDDIKGILILMLFQRK